MLDTLDAWVDAAWAYAESKSKDRFSGDTRLSKAAQVSSMLTVVVLGIVIILGVLIYSQVQNALPTPSNSDLANASDNATTTFGDAMELAPVVLIVIIASLVIGVVQRFR